MHVFEHLAAKSSHRILPSAGLKRWPKGGSLDFGRDLQWIGPTAGAPPRSLRAPRTGAVASAAPGGAPCGASSHLGQSGLRGQGTFAPAGPSDATACSLRSAGGYSLSPACCPKGFVQRIRIRRRGVGHIGLDNLGSEPILMVVIGVPLAPSRHRSPPALALTCRRAARSLSRSRARVRLEPPPADRAGLLPRHRSLLIGPR